jgi:hypothetical protein
MPHRVPVRLASHDDADQRCRLNIHAAILTIPAFDRQWMGERDDR